MMEMKQDDKVVNSFNFVRCPVVVSSSFSFLYRYTYLFAVFAIELSIRIVRLT